MKAIENQTLQEPWLVQVHFINIYKHSNYN